MNYQSLSPAWKLDYVSRARSQISNNVAGELARFRQPFYLTFFPDELIIESQKVVWMRNKGPFMSEIDTIMATDIACVYASSGPFFGHVHVRSLTGGPEIMVDKLPKQVVFAARSLIEEIALNSRQNFMAKTTGSQIERESIVRAAPVQTASV